MGLFKPAWKNNNEGKVLKAVGKLTDQNILANLAKNGKWPSVRVAAIKNLTVSTVLVSIAQNAKSSDYTFDFEEGIVAVNNLTDQFDINEVAKNAKNKHVREAAVKKLTDQVMLAEIEKNANEDELVRSAAAKKLDDPSIAQKYYARNAINGKGLDFRIESVGKLTDQKLLAEVAKRAADHSSGYGVEQYDYIKIRETAANRLTDQTLLNEVAKDAGGYLDSKGNHRAYSYAQTAVNKLTDQSLLVDVAKNAIDINTRLVAIDRIADQAVFTDIALTFEQNVYVRQKAVKKLTDINTLITITNGGENNYVWQNTIEETRWDGLLDAYVPSGFHTEIIDLRETARERLAELQG